MNRSLAFKARIKVELVGMEHQALSRGASIAFIAVDGVTDPLHVGARLMPQARDKTDAHHLGSDQALDDARRALAIETYRDKLP